MPFIEITLIGIIIELISFNYKILNHKFQNPFYFLHKQDCVKLHC